ncbi:hypothetical protein GGR74_000346 [Xanthomonas arboricola]
MHPVVVTHVTATVSCQARIDATMRAGAAYGASRVSQHPVAHHTGASVTGYGISIGNPQFNTL